MNSHITQILLSLTLCLGGCNSSRTDQSNTTINDYSEDQAVPSPPIPSPAPAPGTVHAKAEILSISPEENGYLCKLKILSVSAYGMGARPLPEGTEINTTARKETVDTSPALTTGVVREVILKYQQMPNLPGLEDRAWSIYSIQ